MQKKKIKLSKLTCPCHVFVTIPSSKFFHFTLKTICIYLPHTLPLYFFFICDFDSYWKIRKRTKIDNWSI